MYSSFRSLSRWHSAGAVLLMLAGTGCATDQHMAARSQVAVTRAAVDNAAAADGVQFAPVEMAAARANVTLANQAMVAKDYKLATELANKAQADATLAQNKARTAKEQAVTTVLEQDIRILRTELDRARAPAQQ